jgi:hypothetical protein
MAFYTSAMGNERRSLGLSPVPTQQFREEEKKKTRKPFMAKDDKDHDGKHRHSRDNWCVVLVMPLIEPRMSLMSLLGLEPALESRKQSKTERTSFENGAILCHEFFFFFVKSPRARCPSL